MTGTKYIGMDVHKESISSAVMNGLGKIVMESVIETKASTILQFIQGLHGELYVTFHRRLKFARHKIQRLAKDSTRPLLDHTGVCLVIRADQ